MNSNHSEQNKVNPKTKQSIDTQTKRTLSNINKSKTEAVDEKEKQNQNIARKMFLLSLVPEVNSMTENQMRMFRKGVVNLVDHIIHNETLKEVDDLILTPTNQQSFDIWTPIEEDFDEIIEVIERDDEEF